MRRLSFVLPFYSNPAMLAEQYRVWSAYPSEIKGAIEILIVDDGSPSGAAIDVQRPDDLPALKIFRILIDKPWNQHGARNLGAKAAAGPWLFLTDMDHVMPAESLARLMERGNRGCIYTFARLDAPDLTPTLHAVTGQLKPHPNSFAMTREMFWRIGGYDERWCGVYGTDGIFRKRAQRCGRMVHLTEVPIIRYPRTVIPDASTTTLARKEGRGDGKERIAERIMIEGSADHIETITFPWERQL